MESHLSMCENNEKVLLVGFSALRNEVHFFFCDSILAMLQRPNLTIAL